MWQKSYLYDVEKVWNRNRVDMEGVQICDCSFDISIEFSINGVINFSIKFRRHV